MAAEMIPFLRVLHVLSLFALAILTGTAFAGALPGQSADSIAARRKVVLMWSGIASLLIFLTGFAMLGMTKSGFPFWAIVKVACWLALSALAGLAFRQPNNIKAFSWIAGAAAFTALVMVFFRPHL